MPRNATSLWAQMMERWQLRAGFEAPEPRLCEDAGLPPPRGPGLPLSPLVRAWLR